MIYYSKEEIFYGSIFPKNIFLSLFLYVFTIIYNFEYMIKFLYL